MARRNPHTNRKVSTTAGYRSRKASYYRRLRYECLEDRRLLATLTVNSVFDGPVDLSDNVVTLRDAIAAANDNVATSPGGQAGTGADTIVFAPSLSGQTITLGGTELAITEAVTIDTTALTESLTIDADLRSRIFDIDDPLTDNEDFDVTLAGLVLTRGRTTGHNPLPDFDVRTYNGGAIRSLTSGTLTIDRCTIRDNSTAGDFARGGAIYALGDVILTQSTANHNSTLGPVARGGGIRAIGDVMLVSSTVCENSTAGRLADGGGLSSNGKVTLTQSTVNGNSTAGYAADGGGVRAHGEVTLNQSSVDDNSTGGFLARGGGVISSGKVTLSESTVAGNSTAGDEAQGGGICAAGDVTLTRSTVSGNSTAGDLAIGGGILARAPGGNVTLTQSTISGNSTAGYGAEGGGIFAVFGATLNQSTVSGNSTSGQGANGGGIYIYRSDDELVLTQSTITDNHAYGAGSEGGGIFCGPSLFSSLLFIMDGSILAGNTADAGSPDLHLPQLVAEGSYANYNIIGTGDLTSNQLDKINEGISNLLDVAPLLAVLSDNGGLTQTHAPLGGSPAINAGAPDFDDADVPFDQRGAGFPRVVGGRSDIGAFESEFAPPNVTDDSYAVNEDIDLAITLPGVLTNDADPNGDALTAVLENGPSHGSLNLNDNGSFNYTPDSDFYGTDLFTYRANDGFLESEVATVSITVYAVNDAPTITTASVINVDENNTAVIDVNATDVDGDAEGAGLIYSLSGGADATRFTVDPHSGELNFIVPPDYENPSDEDTDNIYEDVKVTVTDSGGLTNVQGITVIVHNINEPPMAVDDAASTDEDVAVVILVTANDNDPDGDSVTVTGASDPPNGFVTINADGTITYTPDIGFHGIDSFMYTVADHGGFTDMATVKVMVLSSAEQLAKLGDQVQILLDDSVLNHGQANALTTKLEHISTTLDAGKTRVVINLLAAFTNQVTNLIEEDVLTPEEGQPLIDAANNLLAGLRNRTDEEAIDLVLADFGLDDFVM